MDGPETTFNRDDFYPKNVEVTVIIRNLTNGVETLSCTTAVSPEMAVDSNLETPLIERAAVEAVRTITGKVLADARHEKVERERLEMMLGGPVSASRMAESVSRLLDAAGDAEYAQLASEGKEEAMWTPGADPYGEVPRG